MAKVSRPIFPQTRRRAERLGERLRTARLRRRISATEMAARAEISRVTLHRLESGDPAVSMAVVLRVLTVLGLDEDIDAIARNDELGQRLQDVSLRRPRRAKIRPPHDE